MCSSVGRPFLLPLRLDTRLLTTTHALSFYNIRNLRFAVGSRPMLLHHLRPRRRIRTRVRHEVNLSSSFHPADYFSPCCTKYSSLLTYHTYKVPKLFPSVIAMRRKPDRTPIFHFQIAITKLNQILPNALNTLGQQHQSGQPCSPAQTP